MYEIWSVGHKPFEGISNEMVIWTYDREPSNHLAIKNNCFAGSESHYNVGRMQPTF